MVIINLSIDFFIYLFSLLLVNESVSFNLDCLSSLTRVKVSSLVPSLPTGNSAGRPGMVTHPRSYKGNGGDRARSRQRIWTC